MSGKREQDEILTPIKEYGLKPYVTLYGAKHGEELNELFNHADFAIGSLGRHRSGIYNIKTLKTENMRHVVSHSHILKQMTTLIRCLTS